jgi:hypothetical protein
MVDATMWSPHFAVSSLILLRLTCHFKDVTFSTMMYMLPSVSTVSRTFIMPGCLSVRSFRNEFLARGRRDLFF